MKSIRTDPRNHAGEGDERIRTAVTRYSDFSRYESGPLTTVYFIQDEFGPIKIGYARDLVARLRGLQSGNPRELTVLGYFEARRSFERFLHSVLHEHVHSGEWFEDHPDVHAALAVSLEMWGQAECGECARRDRYTLVGARYEPVETHTCPEGMRSRGPRWLARAGAGS